MRLPISVTLLVGSGSKLVTSTALSPDEIRFGTHETTVGNLGVEPSEECFYDVTIPTLLAIGYRKYAWIPWTDLSNASLALAPHGAFVYKTVNDTLVYEAVNIVPFDSPEATIKFGYGKPFCSPATTFDEITSGMVNCSDDEEMNKRIRKGLDCWPSTIPDTSTAEEQFAFYSKFAWVSSDPVKCGEYVYESKDGSGLIQHSCADLNDGNQTANENNANTTGTPAPSGGMILGTALASFAVAGAMMFV